MDESEEFVIMDAARLSKSFIWVEQEGDDLSEHRRRNPVLWLVLIALVVVLGLGSRRFGAYLPDFVAAYAGDTLWALAAFLGIGLLLARASTRRVAALALLVSLAVEVSQLYHAPWIDSIRSTKVGGLLLGFGFVWSDLACYAVGVGLGVLIEGRLACRTDPKR